LEELITKFTDASTYQYLAAAVALVWLVGVTGIRRGRGGSADAAKELGNAAKDSAVSALKSDAVKQVAAATAAGALAASVVPVIGTGVGATAGAILGA
jgi:hypothetical protein